jgi:hypothetical protein
MSPVRHLLTSQSRVTFSTPTCFYLLPYYVLAILFTRLCCSDNQVMTFTSDMRFGLLARRVGVEYQNRHRRNLRRCKGDECHPPPSTIFFLLKNIFFLLIWRGKIKVFGPEWGKECMYIKDLFKHIFTLFLTWLLRKLKFLTLMVDFDPTPPVLLAKLRLWK